LLQAGFFLSSVIKKDVVVIGGGVNGAGIARDLSGRGLSVLLCEKNDLASATSSASTKLIHGGLRYLEHYEFRLVREALKEREVLLKSAPHIIWPLTFILPHHGKLRPRWLIRLGLFIYDHLGGARSLPGSKSHYLTGTTLGQPLKLNFKRGFSYSDCWVEDTRLVVLNAVDAAEKGADIMTRTACTGLTALQGGGWHVTLRDEISGESFTVETALVVNAAGPWVAETLKLTQQDIGKHKVRWVKGSHLIVPRLYQGEHAYILQNADKRIVFVIPYEKKYSLIGTTDVDYKGNLDEIRVDLDEVEYLCQSVSVYFRHPVKPEDVLWTYSGVRPLVDDGTSDAKEVTRDYIIDHDICDGANILSVYGGKITTFRRLSEQVADQTVAILGRGGQAWTAAAPLPGAETSGANFDTFVKTMRREFNWLPESLAHRLARAYGGRVRDILRGCKRLPDLGRHFGEQVYEAEIRYMVTKEWARTLEDVLWRRSKLGLHISEETERNIQDFLNEILTTEGAI
jgi:glycerol-3-phosphate dehydrogenase